ncbi:MAG: leuD [Burkholderiales bacterium]|jgi:3-isopropylmalate/(R)-2-methylmalate dehydratase small subunit|nr:leuD [Burkholderiales bacterium]
MEKFNSLTAQIIPLDLDNVDTDMIIPAVHLKSVSKDGYGEGLFSALRTMYPDFILNNNAYKNGKILVSKANFGCGSSREHAVWAITQYGIRAVVCSSFSDIFYNNAAKNGLLLIKMPENLVDSWISASLNDASLEMTIDLPNQTISILKETHKFDYDPYNKHCLINGHDDLDYLLSCAEEIKKYEEKNSSTTG